METALLHKQAVAPKRAAKPDGTFLRRSAVTVATAYSAFAVLIATFLPQALEEWPLWSLWVLVIVVAIATYGVGTGQRRKALGQSRRTQRWVNAHRS